MSSKGCMYTAQGSLICGSDMKAPVRERFYEEAVEEVPVEGYYEEVTEEQPAHEGYYEEVTEEQPVYEGYGGMSEFGSQLGNTFNNVKDNAVNSFNKVKTNAYNIYNPMASQ